MILHLSKTIKHLLWLLSREVERPKYCEWGRKFQVRSGLRYTIHTSWWGGCKHCRYPQRREKLLCGHGTKFSQMYVGFCTTGVLGTVVSHRPNEMS